MSSHRVDVICSIGGRPAAEVASLRAWTVANEGTASIRRVLLIDSTYTARHELGDRVREALLSVLALDNQSVTLEHFTSDKPSISELLKIYKMWSDSADPTGHLLFCAQPGLAFLNVQFFARPPQSTHVIFNEGPLVWFGPLSGGGTFRTTPIPRLGVDMILRLHGTIREAQNNWPDYLKGFYLDGQRRDLEDFVSDNNGCCNTEVICQSGARVKLHGLWENRGRLFGALFADPDTELKTQGIRLQAKEVSSVQPLQITVTLISASAAHREVWQWFGFPAVSNVLELAENAARLAPELAAPHRIALSATDEPDDFRSEVASTENKVYVGYQQDLSDVNLVCWMNEDPLVTLTTIWTHRPSRCWLLYDKDQARVCRSIYRLLLHAARLPVGELRLVPSNKLATGIREAIPIAEDQNTSWIANVSSGSKVQVLSLATLDQNAIALYSIDNTIGAAVPLVSSESSPKYPKKIPPLWITASIAGGALRGSWDTPTSSDQEHPTSLLTLRILVSYYREMSQKKKSYDAVPHYYRSKHGSLRLEGQKLGEDGAIRSVRITPHGIEEESTLFEWEGGEWLEFLVGHALTQLDDSEVCIGFEWSWTRRDGAKGETDVVASHRGSIYVFECKAWLNDQSLEKGRAQARNMASACFGRFAIPVVVVPWIDEDDRQRLRDNPVPVICLDDLLNKDSVVFTLDWLKEHQTTFK